MSEEAALLLDRPDNGLIAPANCLAEVANTLRKKVVTGDLTRAELLDSLVLASTTLDLLPLEPLVDEAAEFALDNDCTVYDALYAVLALQRGCLFITADERLARGLNSRGVFGVLSLRELSAQR